MSGLHFLPSEANTSWPVEHPQASNYQYIGYCSRMILFLFNNGVYLLYCRTQLMANVGRLART